MGEIRPDLTGQYRCFRCSNGCIHVVFGNTMINLSQSQFLALFDALAALLIQLQAEGATAQIDSGHVVM